MTEQTQIVIIDGQPCEVTLKRLSEQEIDTWIAHGTIPSGHIIVCAGIQTAEDALAEWEREAAKMSGKN